MKPSIAMLLLGSKKPSDGSKDEDKVDDKGDDEYGDESEHMKAAAEELISAVKAGDADKVVKAFSALHHLCAASDDDDESEDEAHEADEEEK